MSILSRALSVYSLPQPFLDALSVRSIQAAVASNDVEPESKAKPSPQPTPSSASLSCQTCPGVTFETVEDQRNHFKSDWHRYNAKAKLTGRAVGAEEWEGMVEGVSSISGSASSSSSGSSHSDSKVTRLLNRSKLQTIGENESDEEAELADQRRRAQLRTAVIWFSPTSSIDVLGIAKDTQLGVHRALFPPFENASDYLTELKSMQLSPEREDPGEERRITLLMVAGGHFAGMVVGIRPRGKNDKQEVKSAGEVRVLQHKTFHRYTTRKKQGGSQGLNDNSKSKAISAGAMLRRYGEQALQEEIRQLLTDWEEDLQMSERTFLRASTHGKKSFWGYDGAVLKKTDSRIRVFPFPTRRPTQQELLRCWHELTRVKISHLSEDALKALDDAYIASLQPRKQPPKVISVPASAAPTTPAPPRLSPEEEARQDRHNRLAEMIRKGRLDALKPFWTKYRSEFDDGVLGIAASSGQEEVIRWMLEDERLDPTFPIEGRRAYDLSSTKEVRNTFRRIAHKNPVWWDWKEAHVPSGLSEEMEAVQEKKKAERRKGLKEKLKEREKARADSAVEEQEPVKEVTQEKASEGPQKLGGRLGGADVGLGGMTPEMRMRVERERRARAAEARLR